MILFPISVDRRRGHSQKRLSGERKGQNSAYEEGYAFSFPYSSFINYSDTSAEIMFLLTF